MYMQVGGGSRSRLESSDKTWGSLDLYVDAGKRQAGRPISYKIVNSSTEHTMRRSGLAKNLYNKRSGQILKSELPVPS